MDNSLFINQKTMNKKLWITLIISILILGMLGQNEKPISEEFYKCVTLTNEISFTNNCFLK